jgi:hypothetical protein
MTLSICCSLEEREDSSTLAPLLELGADVCSLVARTLESLLGRPLTDETELVIFTVMPLYWDGYACRNGKKRENFSLFLGFTEATRVHTRGRA